MKTFIFQNTTRYYNGKGVTAKLGCEIEEIGVKKVLLLAGGGSIKNNGAYVATVSSLQKAGIEWVEKWGVIANPLLEHAREALELLKENECEAIVAVGGGSVIDEAKGIAAGYYQDDIWDPYVGKTRISQALPIFAVLTLSATASEANANSVLSSEEHKRKLPVGHSSLMPIASFVDPTFQFTLPWNQTVNGTIDSLSHIFEAYFTATLADEVTLALNEALIRTLIKSCDILQKNPEDFDARANLSWASTMALNGLTKCGIGGDWACHRMEHAISGEYHHIAHAEGLAVLTPAWIHYAAQSNPDVFERFARNIFGAKTIMEGIRALVDKFKSWGAPTSMNDLNVSDEDFEKLAEIATGHGAIGSVIPLDKNDVIEIFELSNAL
jgi:alcohol dehydrogenase YqhD (iron-dependent ADH family)